MKSPKIAIILPAYNEELTIASTIGAFHKACPHAYIYVIDNNSKDNTNRIARQVIEENSIQGGVFFVARQGKANAMRWAFTNIESEIYVMCDADATYPAEKINDLLLPVLKGEAEMVVGDRLSGASQEYRDATNRQFHSFGNQLIRLIINKLFRAKMNDILSGFRVFSRRFVLNFPILSEGFELETEMTLFALDRRFEIREIPTPIVSRPEGSASKLNTITDGTKVIRKVFSIFRDYRPFLFFGGIASFLAIMGLGFGAIPVYEFISTGTVLRFPTAILASSLIVLSVLVFAIGLILQTVERHHRLSFERGLINFGRSKKFEKEE
ncbi:MAG: glycosyltransferase family 2 protein [Puniceicoccales bacterium]|jgi:glycosyltransferase involved in cell wall biosynthesis|nr:glycosyltransferase family 2 protein [Puniceicoccales bacterium]